MRLDFKSEIVSFRLCTESLFGSESDEIRFESLRFATLRYIPFCAVLSFPISDRLKFDGELLVDILTRDLPSSPDRESVLFEVDDSVSFAGGAGSDFTDFAVDDVLASVLGDTVWSLVSFSFLLPSSSSSELTSKSLSQVWVSCAMIEYSLKALSAIVLQNQ